MQNNDRHCPSCYARSTRLKYTVGAFRIVKCRYCGFVFTANPVEIARETTNYDNYFRSASLAPYEASSRDSDIQQAWQINERRLNWIKSLLPEGKLLDIGCGRGYFLSHAINAGYAAEGIELSRLAARFASEQFGLTVHLCNLDNDPPLEQKFDIITMWHVLEHYHYPQTVLEKVKEMLNPEGILFIEVPNLNSLKFRFSPPSKKWRGGNHPQYHRSFFSHSTLARMLHNAGFGTVQTAHLVYPLTFLKGLIKRVINQVHCDAFLDIVAKVSPPGR